MDISSQRILMGSSLPPVNILYSSSAFESAGSTVNIGSASANRYLIIGANGRAGSATGRTITSITINGTECLLCTATGSNSGSAVTGIGALLVPTGTTANIAVTYNSSMSSSAICVVSIESTIGLVSTATASANTTSTSLNASINVPAGGFVFSNLEYLSTTTTPSWNNLTERLNITSGPISSAAWDALTSGINETSTVSYSSGVRASACWAIFR